jgi:hypothetical protein
MYQLVSTKFCVAGATSQCREPRVRQNREKDLRAPIIKQWLENRCSAVRIDAGVFLSVLLNKTIRRSWN